MIVHETAIHQMTVKFELLQVPVCLSIPYDSFLSLIMTYNWTMNSSALECSCRTICKFHLCIICNNGVVIPFARLLYICIMCNTLALILVILECFFWPNWRKFCQIWKWHPPLESLMLFLHLPQNCFWELQSLLHVFKLNKKKTKNSHTLMSASCKQLL